ncbi:MAG TPA: SGNH/GDSL hydrolase family protein [Kofleriaceae bacterium]|nr:SGNH/GDSL hydrolase family protein [Kofleriaceae bacterium]
MEAFDSDEHGLAGANYVALGDSYASGTGTREYYDSGCQRSIHSYAKQLAAQNGMNLSHVACSGARIPDVRANQLGALSATTNLVTISIGGNDAGFSNVITQCAKPWPWTCTGDITNARNFISNTLPGQLNTLYTEIQTRAPNAQVIVVGYPRLFNGQECNLGARISSGEQSDLNGVADLLATKISAAATAHGFDFVDARGPFQPHRICDAVEWLNGLSNPIGESYHPNRLGHDAFTDLISAKL